MDVCGLVVHQVTYLDIWVRQVIIIDSSYSSCLDACFGLLLWTPVFSCHDSHCVFLLWLSYDLQLWFYTLGYSVAWDKGIYMRVSLFGLFLRGTSLMRPWPKRIKSILLIIGFTSDFLFYDCYVIPVHTCSNLSVSWVLLTWNHSAHLCSSLLRHLAFLSLLAWGVSLTPLDLTFRSWS